MPTIARHARPPTTPPAIAPAVKALLFLVCAGELVGCTTEEGVDTCVVVVPPLDGEASSWLLYD